LLDERARDLERDEVQLQEYPAHRRSAKVQVCPGGSALAVYSMTHPTSSALSSASHGLR
jgi:hypothetical protein